jgi:hypothetical protein
LASRLWGQPWRPISALLWPWPSSEATEAITMLPLAGVLPQQVFCLQFILLTLGLIVHI